MAQTPPHCRRRHPEHQQTASVSDKNTQAEADGLVASPTRESGVLSDERLGVMGNSVCWREQRPAGLQTARNKEDGSKLSVRASDLTKHNDVRLLAAV